MNKLFCQALLAIVTAYCCGPLLWEAAVAEDFSSSDRLNVSPDLTLDNTESSEESTPMDQVTSVSQLGDVQPTDWAFQALQSLVERYGCIEGYPESASAPLRERTYRGNRAMTRYEFAAGLNKCLDRIQELIAALPQNVSKEDLAQLQRLQEEFASELGNLRGRVDALEARATTIEKQQFSTITKLRGRALFFVGDAFGKNAGDVNNTTLSYQSNLNFTTSFTGRDSLVVLLGAANVRVFDTATEYPKTRLSGPTDESRLIFVGSQNGEVTLSILQYVFPVGDKLTVFLDAFTSNRVLSAPITQLNNQFFGPLSYYGRINPLINPLSPQSGIGLKWDVAPWLSMDFNLGTEFGSNNPNRGLFNGGYAATVRSVMNFGQLRFTGYYVHSYSPAFGIDTATGSNAAKLVGAGPVVANTYVAAAFYRLTPTFEFGGSVGYSEARALGSGTKGDAEVLTYDIDFSFYDLGKKGNVAGLILGVQPRLTGTSNGRLAQAIGLPAGERSDRDTGYHIEVFYTHRLTDNISITPGVFWLTAPNHDDRNPDVIIGVIRTNFAF